MVTIEHIDGLSPHLYERVAPLVMNPEVLKQNRNYPFKTTKNHQWLIAIKEEKIIGFVPIEVRGQQAIINNYYTQEENQEILDFLLKKAIEVVGKEYFLISVTQSQHVKTFQQNGFVIEREWKNYVRMRKAE